MVMSLSREYLNLQKMPKYTITQLQNDLKSRKRSVKEVVAEYTQEIKDRNDELNIVLTDTTDMALKQAEYIDADIAADPKILEQKPFLGIPMGVKDMFNTKGVRTTAGSKVLENYTAQYTATAVERLENAGAISLGKLNCDAWAHGSSGENSDFGPTKNPIDPSYVPGGSSSGSAAAVAAGFVPFALGTDTGGSIRQPANFCGIVGYKPTYGRVSRYGVIAMASSLDTVGHLSLTVEDAAKVLQITSGVDAADAVTANSKPFEIEDLKTKSLKGVKIGVPSEYLSPIKNTAVKDNFQDVVKKLVDAGVQIVDIKLPHTQDALAVYYIIQPSEVSSNLARYTGVRFGNDRGKFGDEAIRRILIGTYTLSAGYYDAFYKTALKVRTLIKKDFDQAYEQVDAILTPVSPTPPFKLGEKVTDPLEMYLSDVFTIPGSLAGLCGLALPSGVTAQGLPLGVQLLGDRFAEEKIFPIAYQIEQILK